MDIDAFEHHLSSPQGLGHRPEGAFTVTAGGGSCCDRITFSLSTDGTRVLDAGFRAEGCGAATAAGSAAVALVRGQELLRAARVGTGEVAAELGGLSPGKLHAAELAADALARALGRAVREQGEITAPPQSRRTLVAMSGGVDSAVAALLCAREAETVAVTLELWADPENDAERSCCSATAAAQARALAHRMDLPHLTLDLRREFRTGVVEPYIESHRSGETPNPCVGCNGHVRLDAMLDLAGRLGCEALATGHYARVAEPGHPDGPLLRAAVDESKDQSYMLAALSPSSVARLRFPLGSRRKQEVRALAAEAGLSVAAKPDSQDLCFLAGTSRERFLARHGRLPARPGPIVDRRGNILGRHSGQEHFTVGQRRGLGVAAGEPLFVLAKEPDGRVVVGSRADLDARQVELRNVHLHRDPDRVDRVKLRYRQAPVPARLSPLPGPGRHPRAGLRLAEEAGAAAPGQVACLMDGELVVGWATIARPAPSAVRSSDSSAGPTAASAAGSPDSSAAGSPASSPAGSPASSPAGAAAGAELVTEPR